MATQVAEYCFVGGFLAILAAVICAETDGPTLIRWTVKAFFGLGVLAMLISKLEFWWARFKNMDNPKTPCQGHNHETEKKKMKQAREKTQEKHTALATDYKERVLKPKEEAQLKKKEEKLARLQGPHWKGQGHKLGRISLPTEPEAGAVDTVTVALRDPDGSVHQRRFHSSHTIQNLLDYMTKLGFHQSQYTLSTSVPRCLLHEKAGSSLADCGLTSRVSLNIELMDEEE